MAVVIKATVGVGEEKHCGSYLLKRTVVMDESWRLHMEILRWNVSGSRRGGVIFPLTSSDGREKHSFVAGIMICSGNKSKYGTSSFGE